MPSFDVGVQDKLEFLLGVSLILLSNSFPARAAESGLRSPFEFLEADGPVLGNFSMHAKPRQDKVAQEDFMASMTAMGLSQLITDPIHDLILSALGDFPSNMPGNSVKVLSAL